MKKTYSMPVVRDLSMYEEEMIAASVDGFNGALDNVNKADAGDLLSRESAWDDED
ncbi:MAG: hypothetical protein K6G08_03260 [Prevotella sp.]|nr:hypothetical protein [Prevotella sp.]